MPSIEAQKFVADSILKRPWKSPVIDLGAGEYSLWYKGLFGDAEYKTLDIEQTKKKDIDIIANITFMPEIPSKSYGVVLLLETLEHIVNPFAAFEESARILKPGGIFICTTVANHGIHRHPKDYWRFLPDGLQSLCDVAHLTVYNLLLTSEDMSKPSCCMVAAYKDEN